MAHYIVKRVNRQLNTVSYIGYGSTTAAKIKAKCEWSNGHAPLYPTSYNKKAYQAELQRLKDAGERVSEYTL